MEYNISTASIEYTLANLVLTAEYSEFNMDYILMHRMHQYSKFFIQQAGNLPAFIGDDNDVTSNATCNKAGAGY